MDTRRIFVVSICRYDHVGDNFLPCSFPVTMVTIHDNSSNKQYNRSQINHLADWLTLQGECKQPQMGISHGDTAIQWILRNKHGDTTMKLVEICSSHNFFGVLENLSSLLNCGKRSSKKNMFFSQLPAVLANVPLIAMAKTRTPASPASEISPCFRAVRGRILTTMLRKNMRRPVGPPNASR